VQKEHTLVIDTGNAADVELFLDTIKNESNILLEEFIIDKDCYITTGEGLQQKPLAGQFIASLYQNREIYAPGSSTETEKNSYGQRDILRSTGGLYYKIYCAPHSSCELLRTSIMELVSVLLKTKLIYQWSFARNEDPDHHIRFRLHCRDTRMNEVTAMVGYRLQQEVEKRQVDKYYREKYVREMISYTDSIDKEVEYFCFRSSDMVLHHLKKYAGTDATTANYNLDFIILSVGELFNAFGLAMDERIAQLQNLYEGFFKKLGASSELMISLEKKYDSLREEIAMICKNISKVKKKYGDLELNFFESSRLLADKIRKSNYPFAQRMISDLLQAHLSRLFYSGSEKYELVVFYLLYRHNTGIYFNEKSTAG
jgi:thiopeptide-type bacteriocin biosynthesis protein